MRAIYIQAEHYLDRESVPRTEEYEPLQGDSFIQYDDVSLEKAKHMANGISMDGITRVISTRNNVKFQHDDRIVFTDERKDNGDYLALKIERVQIVVPKDNKASIDLWPKLKQALSDKVLYLK